MKNLFTFLIVLCVFAFTTACNTKAKIEEQQREQQVRDDSIRQAAIDERKKEEALEAEQKRIAADRKAAKEKREADKQVLMQMLATLDADLQAEQTRMGSVQSFHLLRSSSEKEAEVRHQAMQINAVRLKIEFVKDQLQKLENGEEYLVQMSR